MTNQEKLIKEEKENYEPLNLKNYTLSQYIMTAIPGSLITFLLSLVDYLSVGTVYFPDAFPKSAIPSTSPIVAFNYASVSRLLFVISSVVSMVVNNIVTKIGWGVYAGSIVENLLFTPVAVKSIVEAVYIKYKHLENSNVDGMNEMVNIVIINSIIAFMLGTLLFSLLSFGFYASGLSKLLEYIPTPIICGFMGGICFSQFKTFLENVAIPKNDVSKVKKSSTVFELLNKNIHLQMFVFGIIIGLIVYFVARTFPKFSLTIVLSILIGTGLTYIIGYFNYGGNTMKSLRKLKYIKETGDDTFFSIFRFLKIITKFHYIDFEIIWAAKGSILNIGVFSMLHLPINYGVYKGFISSYVNDEALMKKHGSTLSHEMKTQMVMNLIGAFTSFIPSYIVGSYSVAYFRGGGRSKLIGIMGALCNTALPFLGPLLYCYMPVFVIGAIPFYISCCFFYDFIIDIYNKIVSLIYKQPIKRKSELDTVDYNNLVSENFVPYTKIPAYFRHCDIVDFIISCLVLFLVLLLEDYSIVGLLAGFFLCFYKQYLALYRKYKSSGYLKLLLNIFRRDFGTNYIQKADYRGKTYKVFRPTTINFWNLTTFDDAQYPIILDLRDVVYVDILAASRFEDSTLIIY